LINRSGKYAGIVDAKWGCVKQMFARIVNVKYNKTKDIFTLCCCFDIRIQEQQNTHHFGSGPEQEGKKDI
jgi:hypothetical protein